MGINDEIAVSSGSACTSLNTGPSHVLKALGPAVNPAHASLRFGLGRFTTQEEIDYTIEHVVQVVHKLRKLSPFYKKSGKVKEDVA